MMGPRDDRRVSFESRLSGRPRLSFSALAKTGWSVFFRQRSSLRGWCAVWVGCGVVKVDPAEAREDAASSRNSQFSTYGLPEDFRDHSFDLVADIDQHPMRVKWIRQLMVALEAHAESWGPTEAEFESMVIGHATRAKGMMTPQQTYFTLMHMTEMLADAGKLKLALMCVELAITLAPQSLRAHFRLGNLLFQVREGLN